MPCRSAISRARQQVGGGLEEAAFALHRLDDDGRDVLGIDVAAQQHVQCPQRIGGFDAARRGGEWQVVDARRGDAEPAPVGRDLAGERHGEVGAAVEAAGEGDDALSARVGAGDLDGVLDRLGARGEEQRLRRSRERRHRVQPLAHGDIGLVGHDLEGGVGVAVELLPHGGDHARVAMAGVHHGDAAGEIDVASAVGVPERRVLGTIRKDGEGARDPAGDGGVATREQGLVG